MSAKEILILPLDQIAVIDRGRKKMSGIDDLASSIKRNGQITPIAVRPITPEDAAQHALDPSETPWVLVAGGRRTAAHLKLGLPTIRAERWEDLDPIKRREIELEENLFREDLHWSEKIAMTEEIDALKRAQNPGRWTMDNTAQVVKESKANVSRDLKLAAAIKEDPSLKQLTSKVAAMRILDIREDIKRREANPTQAVHMGQLRKMVVTADARDWLREKPEGWADLVFSDLPFGHDHFKTNMRHSYATEGRGTVGSGEYDDSTPVSLDLFVDIIPEIIRITKPTGWIALMMGEKNLEFVTELLETCCSAHFAYGQVEYRKDEATGEWEKIMPTKCGHKIAGLAGASDCSFLRVETPHWQWYRPNSNNVSNWPERHAAPDYEKIIVVNRGDARLRGTNFRTTLVHDAEYGSRLHAHQKPISLAKDVVSRLSSVGELVVDPCFGSGALLAGAAALTRVPVGCDLNPINLDKALGLVGEYFGGTSREL